MIDDLVVAIDGELSFETSSNVVQIVSSFDASKTQCAGAAFTAPRGVSNV